MLLDCDNVDAVSGYDLMEKYLEHDGFIHCDTCAHTRTNTIEQGKTTWGFVLIQSQCQWLRWDPYAAWRHDRNNWQWLSITIDHPLQLLISWLGYYRCDDKAQNSYLQSSRLAQWRAGDENVLKVGPWKHSILRDSMHQIVYVETHELLLTSQMIKDDHGNIW